MLGFLHSPKNHDDIATSFYATEQIVEELQDRKGIGNRIYNDYNKNDLSIVMRRNVFWFETCKHKTVREYIIKYLAKKGFTYIGSLKGE